MKNIFKKLHFRKLSKEKFLFSFLTLFIFIIAGYAGFFFSLKSDSQKREVKSSLIARNISESVASSSAVPLKHSSISKGSYPTLTYEDSGIVTPANSTEETFNKKESSEEVLGSFNEQKRAEQDEEESVDQVFIPTQIIPTQTPVPTPTSTPTPMPTVISNTVLLEIQTSPNEKTSFSVELKEGDDVCDILQTARDEGKINSLTIDDSYLSSLGSRYVVEINGQTNNWTFTVNGESPMGCSLSNPKPNDNIVWKFG